MYIMYIIIYVYVYVYLIKIHATRAHEVKNQRVMAKRTYIY